MGLIKDSVYIFSIARENHGRIVACKSRTHKIDTGRNIFAVLHMKNSEIEHFYESCEMNSGTPSVTLCGKKDESLAVFFSFFAFDTALCLAVRLDTDVERAAYVLKYFGGEAVNASAALAAMPQDGVDYPYDEYKDFKLLLTGILFDVMTFAEIGFHYQIEYVELLRKGAHDMAKRLGVELESDSILGSEEDIYRETGEVFDGGFCGACILVFLMVALHHAVDKRLDMMIVRGFGNMSLEFSFTPSDKEWEDTLIYLGRVAGVHGISFSYKHSGKRVETKIFPFYEDVGFLGVKEGNGYFSLADFYDFFRFM